MVREMKEKEREWRALLSSVGLPVSLEILMLDMVGLWNEGVLSFFPPCGVCSSERIFNALI